LKTKIPIPNELQDRILDFLHNHSHTLKVCALVCKAWVPTTRYHLFSNIILGPRNANSIAEIFENSDCTIRRCIHLEIWAVLLWVRTAAKLLRYLPNLTPSSLVLGNWPFLDQRAIEILAPFPSVEHLLLEHMWIDDLHHLDNVLVRFPKIRKLHMKDCSLPDNTPYAPSTRDHPSFTPRLHFLKISNGQIKPFLRHFVKRQISTNVLSLKYLRHSDVSVVGKYFSMFGSMLQEIRIKSRSGSDQFLGAIGSVLSVLTSSYFFFFHQRSSVMTETCNALQLCNPYLSM